MSIETNIERIAIALEKLVELSAQAEENKAEEVAAEAVEKAATKGRSKKPAATPAVKETKAAKPEPVVESPSEDEDKPIPVAEVQKRAAKLAMAHGKPKIFELIGIAEGADGKISRHNPEQLAALMAMFDELETEIE